MLGDGGVDTWKVDIYIFMFVFRTVIVLIDICRNK